MANIVMKQGLKSAYNTIVKDPNTLYYITDTGEIFLGEKNMSQTNKHFVNNEAIRSADVDTTLAGFTGAVIGDTATLDIKIGESEITKKLSYVFDGDSWVALDQNYDAEEVYFGQNIVVTTAVGNITLVNGQGTIPAKGKNMKQVFESMFTKESETLSVTAPAVTISTGSVAKEVGTTVTPSWSASLSAGSYPYGPATGITATSWAISNNKTSETSTSPTGSFNTFVITEGNCYSITAKANYSAGAVPVSNLGNPMASYQIAAGSKSTTKNVFVGYKPNFYGTVASAQASVDSTFARSLTNQGATTAPLTTVKITNSWLEFYYIIPDGRKNGLSAINADTKIPCEVTDCGTFTLNHQGEATSTYRAFAIKNALAASPCTLTLEWK